MLNGECLMLNEGDERRPRTEPFNIQHSTFNIPRLAFVGLGWIGKQRMNAVLEAGLADAAYTCDPAVEGTMSFDEILATDADAVVIATPSAFHAEQAIAALERGKAVFCQKPLGR